jgi:two-component system sensor kinase FixL
MDRLRFRLLNDETLRLARIAIVTGLAYYIGGLVGLQLRLPASTPSVLWPPNPILTTALLLTAPNRWGAVLFGALVAHVAVELPTGWPTALVTLIFVTNCSEALLAAAGIRWLSDSPTAFDTGGRLGIFLLSAAIVAPLVSTFADAAVVSLTRGEPYAMVWRNRLMSSILGELTIVPALVGFVSGVRAWTRRASVARYIEATLLASGLLVGGLLTSRLAFEPTALWAVSEEAPFVLQLPFLLWAAVRFGPTGASLAVLTSTVLTASAAVHGAGPFHLLPAGAATAATQLLLIVAAVTLLGLATLIEERNLTMRALGDRLAFEGLLSRLSGGFVRVSSDQMSALCDKWLAHLGTFLDLECVRLFEISTESGELVAISEWTLMPDRPLRKTPVERAFPWIVAQLAEQPVVLPNLASLPAEAAVDRASLDDLGYRSLVAIPLVAGGRARGALTFGATAVRDWSADMVSNLSLVAEVFANLLARKQSEDALRTSELMKTGILESLASGVVVIDHRARIVDVNDKWARLAAESGLLSEAGVVVGANLLEVCATAARSGDRQLTDVISGIGDVLGGSRGRFTMDFASGSGAGVRWWQLSVVPLHRCQRGAVITQTEMTERRSAEIAAEQSRRALAHVARVSTVGELTASLAHQLNQPLTGIMSNAQAALRMLSRTPPDIYKIRDALTDVVDADKRAKDVIQGLHALLRKGEPDMTVLDVNVAIRDITKLVADDALTRNISILLDLGGEPRPVWGDRVQLQQVVLNLLLNAMEAIGEDHASDRVVAIGSHYLDNDTIAVSVRDTGAGISDGAMDLVFEPFYTTKPTGMGMGLAIARSIVESHGGRIQMRRGPQRGTIAEFTLPAHRIDSTAVLETSSTL